MPRSSLKHKYSFNIVTICLVVLAGMMVLQLIQLNQSAIALKSESDNSFIQETQLQLAQRARDLSARLAHNVGVPFMSYDMITLYEHMLPVRKASGVNSVYFYDLEGVIVHDGTREIDFYGESIVELYPRIKVNSSEEQIFRLPTSIAVAKPVELQSAHVGGVIVEISTQGFFENLGSMQQRMDEIAKNSMRRNLTVLGLISATIAVVSFILATSAGRKLSYPVTELKRQAERIGLGDYDTQIEVDRDDEIGDLANAFNHMRENLKTQKEKIEYQLYYDQLTGLRNRRSFHDVMSNVFVNSSADDKHVLLYIDIDEFKRINDALGHAAGDRLLKHFAEVLKTWANQVVAGQSDCEKCELGRWDGDQFVVLFRSVSDVTNIREHTSNVLRKIAEPSHIAGIEIVVSASAGYAIFPDDARDSDALVTYADLAMYRSKERGQNLVSSYLPQSDLQPHNQLVMESEIRRAFKEEKFVLKYCPVVDATSRSVLGLEQMVYWNHPERGMLKPRHFMPALVSSGLYSDFRQWGVNNGLDHLKQWKQAGFTDIHLSFNLVSLDFDPGWLGNMIAEALERTQIDSRSIQLEIAETHFSTNMMLTSEILNELKIYGLGIWIDSFGTGYTALNRLRRMAISGIKIHSGVIGSLNTSNDCQNLVSASIAMAHGLGLIAGADGIVNEKQWSFLRSKNCDMVQGELISAPLSANHVTEFLKRPSPLGPRLRATS